MEEQHSRDQPAIIQAYLALARFADTQYQRITRQEDKQLFLEKAVKNYILCLKTGVCSEKEGGIVYSEKGGIVYSEKGGIVYSEKGGIVYSEKEGGLYIVRRRGDCI